MKFEDLTAEDQALLNTDLGDFDKLAAEQVATANEMYEMGFGKLASETADALDEIFASEKVAAEKEDKEEDKKDEETEKKAADLGAFIERGYFDGLRKLGSERHGDEGAYLLPLLAEKVAADAKAGFVRKALEGAKAHGGKAAGKTKELFGKAKELAEKHPKTAKGLGYGGTFLAGGYAGKKLTEKK